jgi:hypothetical protein
VDKNLANASEHVRNAASGMAGAIANGAVRSLLDGSNFGDNILAAIPDVIGSTIGGAFADVVAQKVAAGSLRKTAKRQIASLTAEEQEYLQARGVRLEATANGVRVVNFDRAIDSIVRDARAGVVRYGSDRMWTPVGSNAEHLDTVPANWQQNIADLGGLTFTYEDGFARGRAQSRWLTVGGSGALRFITRGGDTFLYTGGSQSFPSLGLTIHHGERPPLPAPSPRLSPREIIANGGTGGRISVANNPLADGGRPFYELPGPGLRAVSEYGRHITESARRHGVDPDVIRAIMWVETTHGYYDAPLRVLDMDKSILPMNINTSYWGDRWGSRESLRDPSKNIDAGAQMLRAISSAMPGASVAAQATVYNHVNADRISDYGKRVENVYNERPWLGARPEPQTPWYIVPRPRP